MDQLNKHRLNIFPEASQEDFTRLLEDIKEHGFKGEFPIVVMGGEILDGWNRYRACVQLCVDPVFTEFIGDERDAALFVMRSNKRRNMTSGQWAALAAEHGETIQAFREAAEQRKGGRPAEGEKHGQTFDEVSANERRTAARVSELFNTNRTYVVQAVKLKMEALDLFEKVKAGLMSISDASKVSRKRAVSIQPSAPQPDIPGVVSTLDGLVSSGVKFGAIYADPPWRYDNQGTRASTDNHYVTMSVDEIMALPVRELAAEKCHLHLWVTNAFLFDAPRIMDAWGFEFKSSFVWVKPNMGIGNYWRNSHEIMLLGVRGGQTAISRAEMSWLECKRGRHSAKPDSVRDSITRLSPGPFLEMFGRRAISGWTVFGNQVEKELV